MESTKSTQQAAPLVKYVNNILLNAIKEGASDIHFEPYEQQYRIRYRRDGMLREAAAPPLSMAGQISARIKILSGLDIAERRLPQDGRFKIALSENESVDCRVSTCPTINGEKLVIRILDPKQLKLSIDALGFDEMQREVFLKSITQPQGMILVTGPTGSGKTVTLYSALSLLNNGQKNISTAEDPVEINFSGINQVNINNRIGLTFSNTLRCFLRQDPDIIMLGEIRDQETAEIAVNAAQTGHLLLSTLHTNNAAEALTRLGNLGIASFNIVHSLSLIIAQRLARCLCQYCKAERNDYPVKRLIAMGFSEEEAGMRQFKAVGCQQCQDGYQGRTGIFEVLPLTKRMKDMMMSGAHPQTIYVECQKEGLLTLHQSGLKKTLQGITSLEEICRVTIESGGE